MRNVYLDTNVILRFLLGDHPELSPKAKSIFKMAEENEICLLIEPVILAECCYVLGGKLYADKFPSKQVIAETLTKLLFLTGVNSTDQMLLTEVLEVYGEFEIDFADAYLAVIARKQSDLIATFDRDFQQLEVETYVLGDG